MKYLILLLIFAVNLKSQENVDTPVKFEFNKLITSIKYSDEIVNKETKIFVKCLVAKNGKVTQTEVISSENKQLEKIIVDAIKNFNGFTPARKNGEFVDSYVTLPFIISPKNEENPVSFYNSNPETEMIRLDKNPGIDLQKLMSKVIYPQKAMEENIEGQVIAAVLINENGDAEDIKIESSDNEIFNEATLNAIKEYGKFKPGERDNEPVKAWVSIPFNFKLDVAEEKSNKKAIQKDVKIDFNKLQQFIKYPEEARKKEVEGKVVLKILVDDKGNFAKYEIEHTDNKLLNEAAINAVKSYGKAEKPATLDGKPTSSWVYLPIQFRLK